MLNIPATGAPIKEAMPSQRTTSPKDEFSNSVPSKLAIITDRRVVKTAEMINNELKKINYFWNHYIFDTSEPNACPNILFDKCISNEN